MKREVFEGVGGSESRVEVTRWRVDDSRERNKPMKSSEEKALELAS